MAVIAKAVAMSNESLRKVRCTGGKVSTRYRVRALSDSLPTYQNEHQKISDTETNIYKAMYMTLYGDIIEGGVCMCGKGVESMQHIMVECEVHNAEREKTVEKVGKIWGGEKPLRWNGA